MAGFLAGDVDDLSGAWALRWFGCCGYFGCFRICGFGVGMRAGFCMVGFEVWVLDFGVSCGFAVLWVAVT